MANKHIKVTFVEGVLHHPTQRFTPSECLELAARAEALDHGEWAEHWLNQGLIEERHLQHTLGQQLLEVRA